MKKIPRIDPGVQLVGGILKTVGEQIPPVEVGGIVLMAFRVTGYVEDCDGSPMATIEHVDKDGNESGWVTSRVGLDCDSVLVVTQEELKDLFREE